MNESSRILVAGGTGLVGSAIVRGLESRGATNVVRPTHPELDLSEREQVKIFFKKERPEYVFLAAAKVGGIKDNIDHPADLISDNLSIQTSVIRSAYESGVTRLIFFGSNCTYPNICPQPMREEYIMSGPLEPTSEPYAVAKLAGMKMCEAYNQQHGTEFLTVIPPTLYGPNDNYDEQSGHVLSSLMSRFHNAKGLNEQSSLIWGSGKPRREFLYVDDLADACISLMEVKTNLLQSTLPNTRWVINVGSGLDFTILELAQKIKDCVGFNGTILNDPELPDGSFRKLLDSSKINSLGWVPQINLVDGLSLTYSWYKSTVLKLDHES